jgi:hypothetical protein
MKSATGRLSGKLDIGLPEEYVKGGFGAITFRLAESLSNDNGASVEYKDTGYGPVTKVTIVLTHRRAATMGGAFYAVGHELRHLSLDNRAMSNQGGYYSESETDARSWGNHVREFYGY